MSKFDAVWARLSRVLMFFGGMAIAGYETVADRSDRFWPYGVALAMMGLPLASTAENVLTKIAGTRQDPPEEKSG